jgi:hypothetical protein
LVNTIRHKLKKGGINYNRSEIVRIGSTPKLFTTTAINGLDQQVTLMKASKPEEKLSLIYKALNYKAYTQRKFKFVVHKPSNENEPVNSNQSFLDG